MFFRAACAGCSNMLLDLVTHPSLAKRLECKDEWMFGSPESKVTHKPFFTQSEPDQCAWGLRASLKTKEKQCFLHPSRSILSNPS